MPFSDPIVDPTGELVTDSIHSDGFIAGATGWSINSDGSAEFNGATFAKKVQLNYPTHTLTVGGTAFAGLATDPEGFAVVGIIETLSAGSEFLVRVYADHAGVMVFWDVAINATSAPRWFGRVEVANPLGPGLAVVTRQLRGVKTDVANEATGAGAKTAPAYVPYEPIRQTCNALFTANVGAMSLVSGTQATVTQLGPNDGFMVDIIGNAVSALVPTGRLQIALFVDNVQKGSQAEWASKESGETQMVSTREWVTGLGVGDHVFEMRANITAGANGQYTLDTGETKIIIDPRYRG